MPASITYKKPLATDYVHLVPGSQISSGKQNVQLATAPAPPFAELCVGAQHVQRGGEDIVMDGERSIWVRGDAGEGLAWKSSMGSRRGNR
jgi:hypothetical protein